MEPFGQILAPNPAPRCCSDEERRQANAPTAAPAAIPLDWGDARPWLAPGETALEIASGDGAGCFALADAAGASGGAIGAEMNLALLRIARERQADRERGGAPANLRFVCARPSDLRTNLEDARGGPIVESASVDLVVCNWVLNPLGAGDRALLLAEARRVLRPGGRLFAAEIAADLGVPGAIRAKPDLWSHAIAGALERDELLGLFKEAGFASAEIVALAERPLVEIKGVRFRAIKALARI